MRILEDYETDVQRAHHVAKLARQLSQDRQRSMNETKRQTEEAQQTVDHIRISMPSMMEPAISQTQVQIMGVLSKQDALRESTENWDTFM